MLGKPASLYVLQIALHMLGRIGRDGALHQIEIARPRHKGRVGGNRLHCGETRKDKSEADQPSRRFHGRTAPSRR